MTLPLTRAAIAPGAGLILMLGLAGAVRAADPTPCHALPVLVGLGEALEERKPSVVIDHWRRIVENWVGGPHAERRALKSRTDCRDAYHALLREHAGSLVGERLEAARRSSLDSKWDWVIRRFREAAELAQYSDDPQVEAMVEEMREVQIQEWIALAREQLENGDPPSYLLPDQIERLEWIAAGHDEPLPDPEPGDSPECDDLAIRP